MTSYFNPPNVLGTMIRLGSPRLDGRLYTNEILQLGKLHADSVEADTELQTVEHLELSVEGLQHIQSAGMRATGERKATRSNPLGATSGR